MSFKHLFQRSLAAAPERLHMAAHSHHLWPDASWLGQQAAWEDAARLADRKWDRVMGEIWPAAQRHVADELRLPDSSTVVFAPNTHELLVRMKSALPVRTPRVLASDGEFHSFRRQSRRWAEAGEIELVTVPAEPFDSFGERFFELARGGGFDLIFVSHVLFGSGRIFGATAELAAFARPEGPWVVLDGYHGFMAVDTDLSAVADRIFYTAGGYKYAMAGEGAALLHAPPGFGPRPSVTGWFAEFDDLSLPPGSVGYARDAMRFMGATFDPSGLYRFVAVRDMLAREGLTTAAIAAHVAELQARLLDRLEGTAIGAAELLNPLDGGPHARFLAFRSPNAERWYEALKAQDVITDRRGDVLRVGLGLYHDARDIDRFADIASSL